MSKEKPRHEEEHVGVMRDISGSTADAKSLFPYLFFQQPTRTTADAPQLFLLKHIKTVPSRPH